MSKPSLSNTDLEEIKSWSGALHHLSKALDRVKMFGKGDYLIKTIHYIDSNGLRIKTKPTFETNSYGAKKKYQVVEIDDNGIPWVKEISSSGQVKGPIMCTLLEEIQNVLGDDLFKQKIGIFEIDPEFVDSMILGPSAYNPTEMQSSLSKTWKDITEHNKKHIKRFRSISQAVSFFKTIKQGDQFWTSSKKYFTVIDIKTVSSRGTTSLVKGPHVTKLIVKQVNGTNKALYPDDVVGKVLYTAAPRSYRREINPNR